MTTMQEDAIERRQHQRRMAQIDRKLAENSTSIVRWLFAWLCTGLALVGLLGWQHHRNQQVVESTPIGELQDLRPVAQPTGFNPVVLVLQTSSGFLSLHEPMNLANGEALVREMRASGRSYVCDAQRTQCAEIARTGKP
ncbi:hypothetical protein [Hydrogenophaga sp.]|uniref:hypothetical protein n=1 Tax=Hydrogenophaga sp. TaxID=1904254 RepID=UPI0027341F59|nr:hypothetical protein [Hydrogenophaga sp.]MDP3474434.1 hypothetical protein [Hydrogenophaga sp.]